jgi:hypothetical protein
MKAKLVIRAGTVVLFGALFGIYVQHGYVKWNGLGRVAFLDYQGSRFDRVMAHPKPEFIQVLAAVIVALIVGGLYELVVAGLSKFSGPAS